MLYGNDRTILKCANLSAKGNGVVNPFAIIDKLEKRGKYDIEDYERTLTHLEEEGYIKINEKQENILTTFSLTHKGYHYRDIDFEIAKSFLLKSVIVPIFVAAVTAYITVLLK